MTDIREASLLEFLPKSIASDEEIIAMSLALDPELRAVGQAIVEAIILPRVSELSEPVLNELGWAFRFNRLQVWDAATVEGKRALLVNIFAIRKKSGTRFAVRRVFDLMSLTGEVVEWWEEGAEPYSYRLRLLADEVGIAFDQLFQIGELTHRFAPARAWLREFAWASNRTATLRICPAVTVGLHTTIEYGGP